MSHSADYLARIDVITARDESLNRKSNMPMEVSFCEAETLYQVCLTKQAELTGAGLDWTKVEELPVLAGAARHAQTIWNGARFLHSDAQKEWESELDPVYDHLELCLHASEYASFGNEELLNQIELIREGDGDANLIQDLNDTALFGRENSSLFEAINFDLQNFETCEELSEKMSDLLAIKSSSESKSEQKIIRDKAFSMLKDLVDEIYACGQYVFWKDKEMLKKFSSEYRRKQNRRNYLKSKVQDS